MNLPPTLSNQLLSLLFKDKAELIRHLKEIHDSPVSFGDIKGRERKRKVEILIKKLEKNIMKWKKIK